MEILLCRFDARRKEKIMESLLKETKTVYETLTLKERNNYYDKLIILDRYIEELKRLRSNGRLIDGDLDDLVLSTFYRIKEASK